MSAAFRSLPLAARFALAILVAGMAAVGLHAWLTRPAAASEPMQPVAGAAECALPSSFPRGRPLLVYLIGTEGAVPARAAPVVTVPGRGATVRVELGPPRPTGPAEIGTPWLAAAIRLPVPAIDELAAVDRAWLTEVLRAWGVAGRLPHGELLPLALDAPAAERERLLRWIR